jgi:hypothetical protein
MVCGISSGEFRFIPLEPVVMQSNGINLRPLLSDASSGGGGGGQQLFHYRYRFPLTELEQAKRRAHQCDPHIINAEDDIIFGDSGLDFISQSNGVNWRDLEETEVDLLFQQSIDRQVLNLYAADGLLLMGSIDVPGTIRYFYPLNSSQQQHPLDVAFVSQRGDGDRLYFSCYRIVDEQRDRLSVWRQLAGTLGGRLNQLIIQFTQHCDRLHSLYTQQLAKTNRHYLRLLEQSLEEQGADSTTPTLEMVCLMATGVASPAMIEFLGTHLTHKVICLAPFIYNIKYK